jgi:hypothetical protein
MNMGKDAALGSEMQAGARLRRRKPTVSAGGVALPSLLA